MKEPIIRLVDGTEVPLLSASRYLISQVANGIASQRYQDDGYEEANISRAIARRILNE